MSQSDPKNGICRSGQPDKSIGLSGVDIEFCKAKSREESYDKAGVWEVCPDGGKVFKHAECDHAGK